MRKGLLVCLFHIGVLAAPAGAQVVAEMTPERIKEAIGLGTNSKDLHLYVVSAHMGRVVCAWSTPFLRVAMLARDAKKNYKTFTEADVPEAAIAPVAEVVCPSTFIGGGGPQAQRTFASVENVVITGKDGKGDAVQPTKKEPMPEEYQNSFGMKVEASGLLATFPLEAVKAGGEFHVIFSRKVKYGLSGCEDCSIEIKFDKVR